MESVKRLFKAPPTASYGKAIIEAFKLKIPMAPIGVEGFETQILKSDALERASEIFSALPIQKEPFPGARYVSLLGIHALDWLAQSFHVSMVYDPAIDIFETALGTVKVLTALPETREIEHLPEELEFDYLLIFGLDWIRGVYSDFNGARWLILSTSPKLVYEYTPTFEPSPQSTGGRIRFLGFDLGSEIKANRVWGQGMSVAHPTRIRNLSFEPSASPLSFIKILQDAERGLK
jgi:hypothetical protein